MQRRHNSRRFYAAVAGTLAGLTMLTGIELLGTRAYAGTTSPAAARMSPALTQGQVAAMAGADLLLLRPGNTQSYLPLLRR
jgi:hypothetical protein